tara:strand:- start:2196 stop:2348 length:153 start_codon:yes stop_codon:yes gene_type:complete
LDEFFAAADCAFAANDPLGVWPPLDLAVEDWMREAAALFIEPFDLGIFFS